MWCIQAYVPPPHTHSTPPTLIHFSKCLPRRLNKCLGRWGKVNLGQTASCWTEGWVKCVKVNCGPFSIIVSCFLLLQSAIRASHQTHGCPCSPDQLPLFVPKQHLTQLSVGMRSMGANKACSRVQRKPMYPALSRRHRPERQEKLESNQSLAVNLRLWRGVGKGWMCNCMGSQDTTSGSNRSSATKWNNIWPKPWLTDFTRITATPFQFVVTSFRIYLSNFRH